ncbi:Uncharacterised protein [Sphingobacterium multivorum]|uniref:Uncharacterized protein n=1 Tax=Sphingobacterium multivorum TaxID=28454 RepID=A0A2X2KSJ1_SPHMU|nr:Uncharacterised protein [Sphingobacterium multivorum]
MIFFRYSLYFIYFLTFFYPFLLRADTSDIVKKGFDLAERTVCIAVSRS